MEVVNGGEVKRGVSKGEVIRVEDSCIYASTEIPYLRRKELVRLKFSNWVESKELVSKILLMNVRRMERKNGRRITKSVYKGFRLKGQLKRDGTGVVVEK